jgi:RIO kinase 1
MLARDVNNLRVFWPFAPELLRTAYGPEIWDLYQRGALHPGVALSGRFEPLRRAVDMAGVMREIDDARAEEAARLVRLQSAH